MSKISLDECISLLQNCKAVIVDDGSLSYPSIWIEGYDLNDEDKQFLYLNWTVNKDDYATHFSVKLNKEIEVSGTSIFLIDDEGDTIRIQPLFTRGLENNETNLCC